MTDLEVENKQLKEEVASLRKELEFYRNKNHVTSNLTDRLSITKYDDGKYTVSSKLYSKSFMLSRRSRPDAEFEYAVKAASHQVKTAFTKDALGWVFEDIEPSTCGNIKFYVDRGMPVDFILMNPYLFRSMEHAFIRAGMSSIEAILRDIQEDAKRD